MLIPGPAFAESSEIIARAHEGTGQFPETFRIAGTAVERAVAIQAFSRSAVAQEFLARSDRAEGLRLELRSGDDGLIVFDEWVSVHAFPAIYTPGYAIPPELEAMARANGFPGKPPYYTVTVLKACPAPRGQPSRAA